MRLNAEERESILAKRAEQSEIIKSRSMEPLIGPDPRLGIPVNWQDMWLEEFRRMPSRRNACIAAGVTLTMFLEEMNSNIDFALRVRNLALDLKDLVEDDIITRILLGNCSEKLLIHAHKVVLGIIKEEDPDKPPADDADEGSESIVFRKLSP